MTVNAVTMIPSGTERRERHRGEEQRLRKTQPSDLRRATRAELGPTELDNNDRFGDETRAFRGVRALTLACTSFMIGPDSTADGVPIVAQSGDSEGAGDPAVPRRWARRRLHIRELPCASCTSPSIHTATGKRRWVGSTAL